MITESSVKTCPVNHGSHTGYSWHGCRCDSCRAANSVTAARHRVHGSCATGRPSRDEDIDAIAVERCLNGTWRAKQLNAAERRAVVALGQSRGMSHREIARRIGMADRSVVRIAAKLREAS